MHSALITATFTYLLTGIKEKECSGLTNPLNHNGSGFNCLSQFQRVELCCVLRQKRNYIKGAIEQKMDAPIIAPEDEIVNSQCQEEIKSPHSDQCMEAIKTKELCCIICEGENTDTNVCGDVLCCGEDKDHVTCSDCFTSWIDVLNAQRTEDSDSLRKRNGMVKCLSPECTYVYTMFETLTHIKDESVHEGFLDNITYLDRLSSFETHQKELIDLQNEVNAQAEKTGKSISTVSLKEMMAEKHLCRTLLMQYPDARVCPKCSFGPVIKDACNNLTTHHGQARHDGATTNNACPQCGFFANNWTEWKTWEGTLHPSFGGQTCKRQIEMIRQEAAKRHGGRNSNNSLVHQVLEPPKKHSGEEKFHRLGSENAPTLQPTDERYKVILAIKRREAATTIATGDVRGKTNKKYVGERKLIMAQWNSDRNNWS